MGAKELYDAGNLSGAIEQLVQDVKSSPRDLRSRTFLFELLCFSGDLTRAERQLDAIAQMSGELTTETAVQVYRNALAAEKTRREFFTKGAGQPKFLVEPPPYAGLHIEALARLRDNRPQEVEHLLEESLHIRPPVKGQIDGAPFENLSDGDDLIGPFLELIVQKDYVWLPFEQIKEIQIQAPRTLRDLLWIPAKLESSQGPSGDVLVPVQYHGSSDHPNDLIKLGRMTDWTSIDQQFVRGIGQRILLADEGERPVLQMRKIEVSVTR
jgi:type VI secretion system protein ImpE